MQQMIDVQREIQSQQLNTVRCYRQLMVVDTNESYRFFQFGLKKKNLESLVYFRLASRF